jgi:4-hydroxybenzoyl-CoA thioesterase
MTTFRTTRTLDFGDCDPSGIAYFPSYFRHLTSVVEEWFGAIGVPWPALFRDRRIGTPTVRLDATFSRPGFHGDALVWALTVERIGHSSLTLHHEVTCESAPRWEATQILVATSLATHRAIAWPDDIRAAITPFLADDARGPAA